MSQLLRPTFFAMASAAFLVVGCDLVNPALPCRSDTDCGATQFCSAEGRCTDGDPRPDGGEVREPDGPAPEDGGVEPEVGPAVEPDAGNDGGEPEPPIDGGDPEPPIDGGDPEPPIDGGDPEPPIDGGDPEPPLDGGNPEPPVDGGEPDVPVDAGPDDAGVEVDGGGLDAGVFPAGSLAEELGFNLSSVDLTQVQVAPSPAPLNLGQGQCSDVVTFNSSDQSFNPAACGVDADQIVIRPSLSPLDQDVVVIHGASFVVPAGKTLRLIGDKPVVIVSLDAAEIDGVIDASGQSERTGDETFIVAPGAGGDVHDRCAGAAGGNADETAENEGHGGGGAGHVTRGGLGGRSLKNGIAGGPGTMGGLITVGGLVGGCRGGDGSGDQGGGGLKRGQGGAGGGAVHIAAATEIRGSGVITVAGAGGVRPAEKKVGGGGGGSGGTIILTPGLHLSFGGATLLATGGGGGSGEEDTKDHSASGRKATKDAPVPLGGGLITVSSQREAGRGGVGGTATGPGSGEDGRIDKTGGGGGGGSAGRIFVEFSGAGNCNLPQVSYPPPTNTGACPMQAVCGDGNTQAGEDCDDGNYNLQGDVLGCGCSPDCVETDCVEPGESGVEFKQCGQGENCPAMNENGGRAVFYCEMNSSCQVVCGATQSCDVICGPNATCEVTGVNSVGPVNLLCAPGSTCNIASCNNNNCRAYSTDNPPSVGRFDPD